jgi:16S rRNA (guanine527-N7)-methyltransferase
VAGRPGPPPVDPLAAVLADDALRSTLVRSRDLGFLGPGPIDGQLEHSSAYLALVGGAATAVDLGSGGGVPGLVLARHGPVACRWRLIDANRRRCAFLRGAVTDLDLNDRVEVTEGRAEQLGRDPELRGQAELVVARSFGAPAVVAECAAPLLAPGGTLLVSEPPDATVEDRWPVAGLASVGLGAAQLHVDGARLAAMTQHAPCPAVYPRRVGVPAKRPLF